MKHSLVALSVLSALVAGCSFAARSPEMYRDDTAKLLEARTPEIKSCYDKTLKAWQDASGTVRVSFTVKKETGEITDAQVDRNGTNAPDELSSCVVQSIAGLKLEPPDRSDGRATFTWNFSVESPATG